MSKSQEDFITHEANALDLIIHFIYVHNFDLKELVLSEGEVGEWGFIEVVME